MRKQLRKVTTWLCIMSLVIASISGVKASVVITGDESKMETEFSNLKFETIKCDKSPELTLEYAIVLVANSNGLEPKYLDGGNTFLLAYTNNGIVPEVTINDQIPSDGVVTEAVSGSVKVNPIRFQNNAYTTIKVIASNREIIVVVVKKGTPSETTNIDKPNIDENVSTTVEENSTTEPITTAAYTTTETSGTAEATTITEESSMTAEKITTTEESLTTEETTITEEATKEQLITEQPITTKIQSTTVASTTTVSATIVETPTQVPEVVFIYNDGKEGEKTRIVTKGKKYGNLPSTQKKNYKFNGWYTQNGKLITKDSTVDFDGVQILYAHWTKITVSKKISIKRFSQKKGKITINVANAKKKASGYVVYCSYNKKFKKAKSFDVKNKNQCTFIVKKVLKKARPGWTYYYRIRPYVIDSTGKKVWGKYRKTYARLYRDK